MDAFFRNMPAILVFLTLGASAWLRGGTQTPMMLPTIPWLLALLFEVLLFFPQRHGYESTIAARQRAWRRLGKDPLLYVTIAFLLVVMVVPFLNRGLCLICDYPTIMAGASPDPRIPFAPFCVDAAGHFNVVLWFVPALTAMLAARHALSSRGKRVLMEMISWNAAALAVLGFIQQATGAKAPFWAEGGASSVFFASFGYPNMAGAFFVMAFAFSIGVWLTRVSEVAALPPVDKTQSLKQQKLHRWLRAHYPLAAAMLNLFAVLSTLCRAAMINLLVLASIAFLYFEFSLLFSRSDRAKNVKKAAVGFAWGILVVISLFIFGPKDWTRELDTVTSRAVLDRVSGKGQYHSRVAVAILKDHPLFGVGGWGYKHFCRSYMTKEELSQMQTQGGANVHNDYLQFLCEHGIVGFGLLVAIFLLLVCPLFHKWFLLYRAACFMRTDASPPSPRVLYCLPPGIFWIILGNVALLFCASGDCPMRSLAVLSHFFVSLACADGYLPRSMEDDRQ